MATTYFTGSTQNIGSTISLTDIALGSRDNSAGTPQTQRVMGVNVTLGSRDKGINDGLDSLRLENKPSGYDTAGVPTYGDGKINPVETLAADYSRVRSEASFRYYTGGVVPTKTKYSELAT